MEASTTLHASALELTRRETSVTTLKRLMCLLIIGALTGGAWADIVKTNDGRRFEGKILETPGDEANLKLDTMITGIRVTLRLPHAQIAEVKRQDVPAGFFSQRPKEIESSKRITASSEKAVLYLDIPIKGAFGKDILAEGVARALMHALRSSIKHVVFTIDSPGGDYGEAAAIFKLLERYDSRLTYHAIVKDAMGESLLITSWCRTIHMLPGARIGARPDGKPLEGISPVRLAETAFAHGQPGEVIGAMAEPARTLVVWLESGDRIYMAPTAPKHVSPDAILLSDTDGKPLTLSTREAEKIGLAQRFVGDADDLGVALKQEGWAMESDYGSRSMEAALQSREETAKSIGGNETSYAYEVQSNTQQRTATQQQIREALDEAKHWDPERGKYVRMNWLDPNFTKAGRKTWQSRTDLSIRALIRARESVQAMKALETDARKLNLEPIASDRDLDKTRQDINLQIKVLADQRDRKSF